MRRALSALAGVLTGRLTAWTVVVVALLGAGALIGSGLPCW